MNAENLGNVVAKPQPNADGSLIYYETDKGFGVHIDATSGKLLQVHHKDTGARVFVDGIEAYDEPKEKPKELTMKEAFLSDKVVRVNSSEMFGAKESYIGKVVSYEITYDQDGDPDLEEIAVKPVYGDMVRLNEWEVESIHEL